MLKNKANFFFLSKNFTKGKIYIKYTFSKNFPKYLAKKIPIKKIQLLSSKKPKHNFGSRFSF